MWNVPKFRSVSDAEDVPLQRLRRMQLKKDNSISYPHNIYSSNCIQHGGSSMSERGLAVLVSTKHQTLLLSKFPWKCSIPSNQGSHIHEFVSILCILLISVVWIWPIYHYTSSQCKPQKLVYWSQGLMALTFAIQKFTIKIVHVLLTMPLTPAQQAQLIDKLRWGEKLASTIVINTLKT